MIGGLIAGLVIGFVVGVAATLVYVRRSRTPVTPARETAPRPAIAPEPAVAEPLPAVAHPGRAASVTQLPHTGKDSITSQVIVPPHACRYGRPGPPEAPRC